MEFAAARRAVVWLTQRAYEEAIAQGRPLPHDSQLPQLVLGDRCAATSGDGATAPRRRI